MECQRRNFLVGAPVGRNLAALSEEHEPVRAVSVLDDFQAFVDLAAETLEPEIAAEKDRLYGSPQFGQRLQGQGGLESQRVTKFGRTSCSFQETSLSNSRNRGRLAGGTFFKMSIYARSGRLGQFSRTVPASSGREFVEAVARVAAGGDVEGRLKPGRWLGAICLPEQ